jgi:transcriptional regulator with XRE-family HTH domain
MTREFNPEMLVIAREARGLTQRELGAQLKIAPETISRIESGFRQPTSEQIGGFARCLEFTEDFFFLDERVRHFGSGCIYHRKRKKASQSALKKLLALVNIRRIQLKKILQSAEMEATNQFIRLDIDESGDPADCARSVRAIWKLPPGPVNNLTRAIEDAGGVIMRCDFGTRDVDAVSQWVPDSPPLFLVNSRIPTDRCRWTLAHELGHIVMHQIPTTNMEQEADRFAAEFLTPQAEIKPYLQYVRQP